MNKKIFTLIMVLSACFANAQEAYTGKGDTKMHLGANFQNGGTGINVGTDYGLGENISIGFSASYLLGVEEVTVADETIKPKFKDRIDAKLRFNANIGKVMTLPEQIDVYPGIDLGLKNFGGHIGARYFFSQGFGLQTEFGVPFAKYDTDVQGFEKLNNQFYANVSMVLTYNERNRKKLKDRSNSACELCGNPHDLQVFNVAPNTIESLEQSILACKTCVTQIENPETADANHWHCLSDSMWNENLPVQIVAWRMLTRLKKNDLLDMMYLDEEALEWAKATGEGDDDEGKIVHKDSNGNILLDGDSVVLIKDLDVKGANFTAKRGAAVHNIKLVWDNAEQIEGRVEGQYIVILTQYVKKTK